MRDVGHLHIWLAHSLKDSSVPLFLDVRKDVKHLPLRERLVFVSAPASMASHQSFTDACVPEDRAEGQTSADHPWTVLQTLEVKGQSLHKWQDISRAWRHIWQMGSWGHPLNASLSAVRIFPCTASHVNLSWNCWNHNLYSRSPFSLVLTIVRWLLQSSAEKEAMSTYVSSRRK
jgi:hypothetical protein